MTLGLVWQPNETLSAVFQDLVLARCMSWWTALPFLYFATGHRFTVFSLTCRVFSSSSYLLQQNFKVLPASACLVPKSILHVSFCHSSIVFSVPILFELFIAVEYPLNLVAFLFIIFPLSVNWFSWVVLLFHLISPESLIGLETLRWPVSWLASSIDCQMGTSLGLWAVQVHTLSPWHLYSLMGSKGICLMSIKLGVVAHACNPNYSGGEDQGDHHSRLVPAKVQESPPQPMAECGGVHLSPQLLWEVQIGES
jgi:hypothetical protein